MDVIMINGRSADLDAFLATIDDEGSMTSAESLREALTGTEHLIDTLPRIAWLWGHLNGLETMAMLQDILAESGSSPG